MRDTGGVTDAIVFREVLDVAKNVSIEQALKQWVYRTPIYGSLPNEPNDENIVNRFVDNYLEVGRGGGGEGGIAWGSARAWRTARHTAHGTRQATRDSHAMHTTHNPTQRKATRRTRARTCYMCTRTAGRPEGGCGGLRTLFCAPE
jgi:hypothetical protein